VSGLMIQLGPGATLSGRILFEGTSALPSSPSNPGQMQLVTGSPDAPTCRTGRAELAPDFTFTVDGVFGTCTVRLNGPFGHWSVKSIVYRGNDLLDQPVTFGTGQRLRDIQVTLTDKRTEVTMQVADERGQPTREYVGLLFSVDKARWTVGSRYIRPLVPRPDPPAGSVGAAGAPSAGFSAGGVTSTPGSSGGPPPRPDTIAGLPPGEYFAVAVDDLDSELMRDGDVLERLSRGARRVTLSEDAKIDVSLRRVKLSDLIADR